MINRLTGPQKKLLILAVSGIIFVWLGFVFIIQPGLHKINLAQKAISTAEERADLINQILNYRKKQAELEVLLATQEMRYELLDRLTSYAKESGMELQSLSPTVVVGDPYDQLLFDLRVETSFPTLVQFLNKLQDAKPGIAVRKLSISAASGRRGSWSMTSEGIPQISLTLEAYLKQK